MRCNICCRYLKELAMKTLKYQPFFKLLLLNFLISVLFWGCSASNSATKPAAEEINNMINSHQFTFVAERMNPLRGSTRPLTSNYDVVVKRDTLHSFLPYFGRAFQAPIDPTKGPLSFESYNFSYNVTLKDKDEWQVYINPKDNSDVQQFYFQIFGNGTATLNVVSTNRDPISFYGHVQKTNE